MYFPCPRPRISSFCRALDEGYFQARIRVPIIFITSRFKVYSTPFKWIKLGKINTYTCACILIYIIYKYTHKDTHNHESIYLCLLSSLKKIQASNNSNIFAHLPSYALHMKEFQNFYACNTTKIKHIKNNWHLILNYLFSIN